MTYQPEATALPVRDDLAAAHERALARVASAGTWWTGAERIALAEASRSAWSCDLCSRRRSALSPFAVDGEHSDSPGADLIGPAVIDAVHRLVSDPARLSKKWLDELVASGEMSTDEMSTEKYVELVGVVTQVVSVDVFHFGLGLPLAELPEPVAGEPSERRPSGAAMEGAWVPMVKPDRLDPDDADLFGPRSGNVIRAMSLVPAEVRALLELSDAQYVKLADIMKFGVDTRAISRAQMELIAGRVSSLNECFY